jgi:hypothetical protein
MTAPTPTDIAAETERAAWDRFVAGSPTGSVFCRSALLDALDVSWEIRRIESNGRTLAAAPVFRDDRGTIQLAPLPFTLYQGVVLDGALGSMAAHRRVPELLRVTTELIDSMEQSGRISFCLHPEFPDSRPFSWFHYHQPAGGGFQIDLRYTGVIALDPAAGMDGVLAGARSVRRQEYRKAKARFEVLLSDDVEVLDELHARTFARQGLTRSEREQRLLRSIASRALADNFGQLLVAREDGGRPVAATLFLFDDRAGYYLVAANDPDYRSAGTSTLMFLAGVEQCLARGLPSIDVVGMNSPTRGDFKASFGAVPKPYLVVTWDRP